MINLKINGMPVSVKEGTTILEAARSIGIKIPTLCHMKGLCEIGACRICVVEVKGARALVASCGYPVSEGMEVFTNTQRVLASRKTTIELILSDHRKDCLSCERNLNCELQKLSYKYNCNSEKYRGQTSFAEEDTSTEYLIRDNSKCILCRRCIAVCQKVQSIGAIGANERGFNTHVGCAFDMDLANSNCIGCGQCVNVCPTGALTEKDEIRRVFSALNKSDKYVVVGTAPSVRAAIGEEFDEPVGSNFQGKLNTALKLLGFKKVFDINCTADLTIMEEANELLDRIQNGGTLPMFTSCCPGWINYLEKNYPELLPHLSSCKSPQQMFGALVKTVFAKREGIDPKDIYVVSVMPCTAKKGEKERTTTNGILDVDAVLTTREIARLIKENGILLNDVMPSSPDSPFGEYTGAGVIFGASGGVMEAALRTAVVKLTGVENCAPVEFTDVRGMDGIKEASYTVGETVVKVAVVNGIINAKKVCEMVKAGKADYQFIEVMTCPGGCINGGGQPIKATFVKHKSDVISKRAEVLYIDDKEQALRRSHNNSSVNDLYKDYFGAPNSEKAHHVLHTSYKPRKRYDFESEINK